MITQMSDDDFRIVFVLTLENASISIKVKSSFPSMFKIAYSFLILRHYTMVDSWNVSGLTQQLSQSATRFWLQPAILAPNFSVPLKFSLQVSISSTFYQSFEQLLCDFSFFDKMKSAQKAAHKMFFEIDFRWRLGFKLPPCANNRLPALHCVIR